MPRPSSPPGAKASTECPSLAQSIQPTQEQPPTPAGAKRKPPPPDRHYRVWDQSLTRAMPTGIASSYTHFLAPLLTATRPHFGKPRKTNGINTGQTNHADRIADNSPPLTHSRVQRPSRSREKPSCPTRPETHQNLIHMYKRPKQTARTAHIPPNGSDARKPVPNLNPTHNSA